MKKQVVFIQWTLMKERKVVQVSSSREKFLFDGNSIKRVITRSYIVSQLLSGSLEKSKFHQDNYFFEILFSLIHFHCPSSLSRMCMELTYRDDP